MAADEAVAALERDLKEIFGARLQSLSVYGLAAGARRHDDHAHETPAVRTLAIVDALTTTDLRACADRVARWHDRGLATPLVLVADEFGRALDAFPLEFGAILANHRIVFGSSPFAALTVDPADVRRACEIQARSHLLHLREGYLETRSRSDALSVLIVESAPALAALVVHLARLDGHDGDDPAAAARHAERSIGIAAGALASVVALVGVREISSVEAERLFAPYLDAVEKLVKHVDSWSTAR